jgi:hypothetical protein
LVFAMQPALRRPSDDIDFTTLGLGRDRDGGDSTSVQHDELIAMLGTEGLHRRRRGY